MTIQPLFTDNPAALAQPDRYVALMVDAARVLQGWRASLMAHELVDANGLVKGDDDLSESRREKRAAIRRRLQAGEALEKPVLGIGIFDNIEIGAGADTLAALVMEGVSIIPVHVRASQLAEFEIFRA